VNQEVLGIIGRIRIQELEYGTAENRTSTYKNKTGKLIPECSPNLDTSSLKLFSSILHAEMFIIYRAKVQ